MKSVRNNIPPYAGLCTREEAQRVGFGADEAARRLRRFAYVLQRLAFMATAHLNATPEWEVKQAFSLHAWLDAEHANMLRKRVPELRVPEAALNDAPDDFLGRAMEEAAYSQGTLELLTASYGVIRPELLAAIDKYLAQSNPVADHPSCRALKIIRREQHEIVEWGRVALEAVLADDAARQKSAAWACHLQAYFAAAKGIDGTSTKVDTPLPQPRSAQPLPLDLTPQRDLRFHGLFDQSIPADVVYADESRPIEERNLALLFKRLREMDVPEAIAGILAQMPGKPWAFYHDMLRQMWDEARHSLLGEIALEARGIDWTRLPVNVTFSYKLAKFCTPLERHILLFAIEQSLMGAQRGKRWEYSIARESGDNLSTTFHDFDWADEVLHAAIGKRHLKQLFHDDYNEAFRQADALARRIAQQLELQPMPEDAPPPDWWERFAEQALGHKVEPAPQSDVKEWSPVTQASA
jgi:hypothetical protein